MKYRTHCWYTVCKGLPFRFCGRCGLINLKNKPTQKAINRQCPGRETEDWS